MFSSLVDGRRQRHEVPGQEEPHFGCELRVIQLLVTFWFAQTDDVGILLSGDSPELVRTILDAPRVPINQEKVYHLTANSRRVRDFLHCERPYDFLVVRVFWFQIDTCRK